MAQAAKPRRYRRRIHDPDKLVRQLVGLKLCRLSGGRTIEEAERAEQAAREVAERRQREVDAMAPLCGTTRRLQRHQQDAARFNALPDALLNLTDRTNEAPCRMGAVIDNDGGHSRSMPALLPKAAR